MVGAGELTMLTWQRWGFYDSFKNFQFDGCILGASLGLIKLESTHDSAQL